MNTPHTTKLAIWLSWLTSLGGSYEVLRFEKSSKEHEPKPKPNTYPLNPLHYYTDSHGSVRKISEKGQVIAERLGI